MLPLLRDKSVIAIGKDRLSALRLHSGKVIAKQSLPISGDVLPALSEFLKEILFKKTDATVILSNHFMRYAVLPWNETYLSDKEMLAIAQHRFAENYGDGWEIRLNDSAAQAPILACATPKDLISGVLAKFSSSGIRLKSIQPYLMHAFNSARKKIPSEPAWFVLEENGLFCIARIGNGQWKSVRLLRSEKWEEAMLAIEREALMSEEKVGQKIYLCSYSPKKTASDPWSLIPLELSLLPSILSDDAKV